MRATRDVSSPHTDNPAGSQSDVHSLSSDRVYLSDDQHAHERRASRFRRGPRRDHRAAAVAAGRDAGAAENRPNQRCRGRLRPGGTAARRGAIARTAGCRAAASTAARRATAPAITGAASDTGRAASTPTETSTKAPPQAGAAGRSTAAGNAVAAADGARRAAASGLTPAASPGAGDQRRLPLDTQPLA